MSISEFEQLTKIGTGSYSSVYKVKRIEDGKEYALKKVKMTGLSSKEKENALNEVRILASINHPNVISYKDAFIDHPSCSLWIIMEYADDGDLLQRIKNTKKQRKYIKEQDILSIFIQVVRGLKRIHKLNIMHRDLKSANVFLNKNGQVQLGDLNVSKLAQSGLNYTQTGTPYYASPEVWKDKPYDFKSDIWSLGWVVYEMASLKPPFRAKNMHELFKKVSRGAYPSIPNIYSKELSKIISTLLKVSSKQRPSAGEILEFESITNRIQLYEFEKDVVDEEDILLKTINLPDSGKMKQITNKLPKSNYCDYSTQSSRLSQNESLHENFTKHIKTNSSYGLEASRVSQHKLEDILQNWYIIKKDNVTKELTKIPKYYAVGERRSLDKNFSSRNYGIDSNDYVCLTNNNSSLNLSKDKLLLKRNNNLMKLKKLHADKMSLERYMEQKEKPKLKRGSSMKEGRSSVSVSHNNSLLTNLPRLPNLVQVNDYNTRLASLQKAISIPSSQLPSTTKPWTHSYTNRRGPSL